MKLTKSLKRAITKQFKDGATLEYIAQLYGFPMKKIEDAIRVEMIRLEAEIKASVDA